jgi:hypothetical protein
MMAMLSFGAYFDESYSGRAPKVMTVAGYLSSVEQWGRFCQEWPELFAELEFRNPFHMTDFMAGVGQFSDWSDAKRIRCMERVTGIILRRTNLRLAVTVDLEAYQQILANHPVGPYGFCIFEWMKAAERFLDLHNISDRIAYFFESGSGFGRQIFDTLTWIKKRRALRERYRLGSFTFADKREQLPLQASDVLAWGARLHAMTTISGDPVMSEPIRLLATRGKHTSLIFRKPELEKWKAEFEAFQAEHQDDIDELVR